MYVEITNGNFSVEQLLNAPIMLVQTNDRCKDCEPELQELQNQVSLYNQKVTDATKVFHETLVLNLKKDLAIRQLKQKMVDSAFNEFKGVLTSDTIDNLNRVDGVAGSDSNFVLKAMRGMYKEDLSRLKNKTYSGRKKDALTPEKKEMLRNVYMKRIDLYEKDKENVTIRKSYFAKYVKNAIDNINKNK